MTSVRISTIVFVTVLFPSLLHAQDLCVLSEGKRICTPPPPPPPQVAQIYIANEWEESLQQLNFATGALTTLYNIGGKPDDLTLSSTGALIYGVPDSGTVNMYDPTTGVNTVLTNIIPGARDLTLEPGGQTLLISRIDDPAEIYRYSFVTNTATVFVPQTTGITSFQGTAYDSYGNLYAVAGNNTIIQLDPVTGATLNTITIEAHSGVNGADGLCFDSYSNSLWATMVGKVLGYGLIQIPVQASGFVSTDPGFTFYSLPYGAPDGIKSDGRGNLYIGAIHTANVYSIPTHTTIETVVTDGADGVALVPGTY